LSEQQAQESKNKARKAKDQTKYIPQQFYDSAIFQLAICAFDIPSGRRDACDRQCEYTRRDLFMGKLNPEKFSQILQDFMNKKYLDLFSLKEVQGQKRSIRHMEIQCQMMRSDPSWYDPSHLNGR
jgi:hypothetical protein